jgi:ubiquitin-conjugating enzyme E2 I
MYHADDWHLIEGIQELLNEPNPRSPANGQASDMFVKKKADYSRKIKQQAAKFAPDI